SAGSRPSLLVASKTDAPAGSQDSLYILQEHILALRACCCILDLQKRGQIFLSKSTYADSLFIEGMLRYGAKQRDS
uniref:hypothetical protein n=1 Tax=Planococcus sp. CAU13 TaxID=1541197 RepID=UPI00052FF940